MKNLCLFLILTITSFLLPSVLLAAPNIDGVMSYTDSNDWGGLSRTTTSDFQYTTTLRNVVVEEGDAIGDDSVYDVEELGLYVNENTLYMGLQTQFPISSATGTSGVYSGDFIFMFGDSSDDSMRDYDLNNDGMTNGDYDYAFAFDFTVNNDYKLHANYPNPFNPVTNIQFTIPVHSDVSMKVYNILGREVATLCSGPMPRGTHTVLWNGTNDHGIPVSSGTYFYRMQAGDHISVRRMLLIK